LSKFLVLVKLVGWNTSLGWNNISWVGKPRCTFNL